MAATGRSLVASSFWSIGAAAFNTASTLVVFIILSRYLTPAQFGIVAFATIFIDISRAFLLNGIPDALIRAKDWDDDLASTAFWLSMGLGLVLCAAFAMVAAPLAGPAYGSVFGYVLAALSLILLVEGSTAVHTAELRREYRFKEIAVRGIMANIIGGCLGAYLAIAGWGVWAMVLGRVVSTGITSLVLWYAARFRPKFTFRRDQALQLGKFSGNIYASQALNQFATQLPALLLGAVIGPSAIAMYRVGGRTLDMLVSLVVVPIQMTAVSMLSSISTDRDAIAVVYKRLISGCALLACPVFLGLGAIAPDFVPLIFGAQWKDAGYVLTAMSLIAGPVSLSYFESATFNAIGRSDFTFYASLIASIGALVTVIIGIRYGAVGVALALSLRAYVTTPIVLSLIKRATGVLRLEALAAVAPPYFCALAMAGIVWGVSRYGMADWAPLARVVAGVLIGAATYPVLLMIFARSYVVTTLKTLPSLRRR